MSKISNLITSEELRAIYKISNSRLVDWVGRLGCPCFQYEPYTNLRNAVFDKEAVSKWKKELQKSEQNLQEKKRARWDKEHKASLLEHEKQKNKFRRPI